MADEDLMDQQTEERLLADDQMEIQQNGHSEEYEKLVDYGIDRKVAEELVRIFKSSKLAHPDIDERALDALKEFSSTDAIAVLKQFCDSNLEHVGNKSAFLCGQMKTYRQRNRAQGTAATAKGPDEAKIKEILERTGYSLDVTTGQRKYGGPPPNDNGQPGSGHEIFCGKIPKDIYEDELIPLFEKCGKIWDLRLMMDPITGLNRGYCFVTFCDRDSASEAVKQLDNYEVVKGKSLKVNISVANLRLFIGNLPKNRSKEEIKEEFSKKTEGIIDVIVYTSADNPKLKNRGFAFLEYDSHKSASTAKRKLGAGRVKVWGCDIIVDWADPQDQPDTETMSKVKVLYVRHLTSDVTEESLKAKFEEYGRVERVKKIKDYGFVHFEERDSAVKALDELNGAKLGGMEIEVSLAKPAGDKSKKELRKREQDRRQDIGRYDDYAYYYGSPGRFPPQPTPMRGGMRRPLPPPPMGRQFDPYYDDYYPYEDYDYYGGFGSQMHRGRGRGGLPPQQRMVGRGMSPSGRGLGGAVALHGSRGARGSPGPGASVSYSDAKGALARQQQLMREGKRKAGGDFNQGQSKRRNILDSWEVKPIAQQPLFSPPKIKSEPEWYQDSYGGQWK